MTTEPVPLDTMKSIMGTAFSPSEHESSTINGWLKFVGTTFPDMADYCTREMHIGYFSWCGATVAYCMANAGIRPVYTSGVDTKSFLWAAAWLGWGTQVTTPEPGDVLVFDFGHNDHHVTLFDHDNGNGTWACRGGNQSHEVNLTNFRANLCMGIRRPPAAGEVSQQVAANGKSLRPELQIGAVGAAVSELQQMLGIAADGEFGPDTDAAVRAFQRSHSLDVDGVLGADTWGALLGRAPVKTAVSTAASLTPALINEIVALARDSSLARVSWSDHRGAAPIGYINGLAVSFARVYQKLKAGDSAALAMTAPIGGPRTDAFAWYRFSGGDRPTMLRQLFVLLYGLGMRESSGNCFEGRDQSAHNVTADTAEAGLFQQSWDSRSASPELPRLFATYSANPDGFLQIFREGVRGSASSNEGTGEGAAFQELCKSCPAFAVEAAAVGLRTIRTHWGPINRHEAEVRPEADSLLRQVQELVDEAVPVVASETKPHPTPTDPWRGMVLADILQRLKGLEHVMNEKTGPGASTTSTTTTPPHLDAAGLQQDIARLGQIAGTLSQFANQIGQLPSTNLPPQVAQIEQSVSRLGQIAGTLSQSATLLSGQLAGGAVVPAQILSPIDKLLGGSALVGLKTPIAIFGYLGLWVLQSLDAVGTATGDKATTTGSVLTALFSGLGAAGVTAKFDRAFQAFSGISAALQKLPMLPPATPPKTGG